MTIGSSFGVVIKDELILSVGSHRLKGPPNWSLQRIDQIKAKSFIFLPRLLGTFYRLFVSLPAAPLSIIHVKAPAKLGFVASRDWSSQRTNSLYSYGLSCLHTEDH